MSEDEVEKLRRSVREYRERLESVRQITDSVRRMLHTSRLTERVIKRHFFTLDIEKPSLGQLLHSRQDFIGKHFRKAAFAIAVRNRMSHDEDEENHGNHASGGDGDDFPTDSELITACGYLEDVVERHCRELEKTFQAEPESRMTAATRSANADTRTGNPALESELPPVARIYATRLNREPAPRLDAADSDPHVTASALAEYTFCPRAGILTHEGGYSDPEDELPSLALLPWYEQDAIEEAYTHSLYVLYALPVGLVAAVVILSLFAIGHFSYPFLLSGLLGVWAIATWRAYLRWRELGRRRLAAWLATECDPVPGKNAFQPVNWWGLLLAGYEVRRPEAALHDERWKLSGKPRRILEKGSLRIPVHRIRNPEGPILPQHIVRVMAHCHLLEATEGANSPFAVVLFGNTYEGMTVPNTVEHRERFYTAVERVRTMVTESDAGERQPPEPATGNICSGCHFGHPRPAALEEKTQRYGEALDPFLLHNGKKMFHCNCGDRFRWKPKHDANQKLRRFE